MHQGIQTSVLLPARPVHGLRLVSEIFKLRIGLVIGFTALAGFAITPGARFDAVPVCALALAITMASAAAGAFNQLAERELDARMGRTRHRPFATGRLQAGPLWFAAIGTTGAAGVALAAIACNAMTALFVFLGAFTYAVVYTIWLKRRTWWNIVIGGLAGSFAVLAGAAAAGAMPPPPVVLAFALLLFLWTPPHFWSLAIAFHEDYAAAAVPMLPVIVGDAHAARIILAGAALVVGASLLPALLGMGWLYLATAAASGAYLLRKSMLLARAPGPRAAMVNFHASLIYLALVLTAAIADRAIAV